MQVKKLQALLWNICSPSSTVPRALLTFLVLTLTLLGMLSPAAEAQDFDPDFIAETVAVLPPFTPVGLTFAPDGRIFIWQKNGVVRVVKNGVLLSQPFIDIRTQVNQCEDRGFLGLALDPNLPANGYVYLLYTFESGGNSFDCGPKTSRLTRVTADPANPDVALANSETPVLAGIPSDSISHSVGTLRFAPDGKLFVGHGDSANYDRTDVLALRAQDLNSYNGKILRINPDGSAPGDNPFDDGTDSVRSKVWAYGLRNPFRFGIDPATGELYIGDVGWRTWEEVNRGRGANFGWPCYEGNAPQPLYQAEFLQCQQLAPEAVTPPLYAYDRFVGSTIIGGVVYSATQYPQQYRGNLFIADYTQQWIRRIVFDANNNVADVQTFATGVDGPVDLELGPDGSLYYIALNSGEVKRIRYIGNGGAPTAVASATPSSGYSPLPVNFSSSGSFDPDGETLLYSWDFGDGTTSTEPNPQHTYVAATVQTFTATLTVTDAESTTASATAKVTVGSLPPVVSVSAPADGTLVRPGDTVVFEGSATDPDDGPLPASSLAWTVLLHHNTHVHPYVAATGFSGSFEVADHGIGEFGFEVILTATDSSGLASSKSIFLPMPSVGPSGLLAAFGFSEGTGATTADGSGNGSGGTLLNGPAWIASGKYGNALSFDGNDDYVAVPDASVLGLSTTGTLEAWVNPATLGSWNSIIAKGSANNDALHNYALEITNANVARCILGNGTLPLRLDSSSTIPSGQFTHLACVWDENTVRLYINGVQDNSTPLTLTPVGNASPLFVGQFGGDADRFRGTIDEVRIYNRALSEAEIRSDMDIPIDPPAPDTAPPTAPASLTATAVSTSRIDLSWPASADNVGVTSYLLERCQGAGCNTFLQIATPTGTTYNDTGLSSGASYSYRVQAKDAANNLSLYSPITSATTQSPPPPDTTAPTPPSNLAANGISSTQVNLTWTASTDNAGVTGYLVERCQGAACTSFTQIGTPAATAYSDAGLQPGTSYSYRVRATDLANNLSQYSAIATATTQSAPPPNGVRAAYAFSEGAGATTADASGNGNTGTLLNGPAWTATGKYGSAIIFDGVNDFVSIPDASTLDLGSAGTIEAWIRLDALGRWHSVIAKGDANSDAAHNYALEITSTNAIRCILGNGSSFRVLDGTTPAAAGQFTHLACAWDGTTLRLYVNGVLNNSIAQGLTPAGNNSSLFIGQFGGNADRLLGTVDEVRIYNRALSAPEIQADMNTPVGGAPPPDTAPPNAPVSLTAAAVSTSRIDLSWPASTDNVAVTGYLLERCQDAGCNSFTQIAAPITTAFSDTGLAGGTSYTYRVRAKDAANNLSPYSPLSSARTLSPPPPDTTAPTAPTNLAGTAASMTQINLTWTAATDNVAVTAYLLERCQSAGCSTFAQIATPTGTTYSDTGLSAGTSYTYQVRARDAANNLSPYSNAASAVTPTPPPPTGVRAAYALSEGAGLTTADASGNGNNGTLLNGPLWTATGKYGNAINFDGVNDFVSIPDSASLGLGATGTIEAWVRLDTLGRWHSVAAKGNANSDAAHNYALEITDGNVIRCILGNGSASRVLDATTRAITGQFTHLACTWDGATLRIYVNGALNGSTAQALTPAANTSPLFIGQFGGNADRLDGTVDEVRIYNRALSLGEIQSDMNTPIP